MIFSSFLWSFEPDRNSCLGIMTRRDRLQFTLPPSQDQTYDQASRLGVHIMPHLPYTQWQEEDNDRKVQFLEVHCYLIYSPFTLILTMDEQANTLQFYIISDISHRTKQNLQWIVVIIFGRVTLCPALFPEHFPLSGDAICSLGFQRFGQLLRQA